LGAIGIPQDIVLKHSCPRIIYGVTLARNAFEYLRGEAGEPEFYFDVASAAEGTAGIVNYWLTRWFEPRRRRSETLAKVAQFSKADVSLTREFGSTTAGVAHAHNGNGRSA
jgi:hypothetical protein